MDTKERSSRWLNNFAKRPASSICHDIEAKRTRRAELITLPRLNGELAARTMNQETELILRQHCPERLKRERYPARPNYTSSLIPSLFPLRRGWPKHYQGSRTLRVASESVTFRRERAGRPSADKAVLSRSDFLAHKQPNG